MKKTKIFLRAMANIKCIGRKAMYDKNLLLTQICNKYYCDSFCQLQGDVQEKLVSVQGYTAILSDISVTFGPSCRDKGHLGTVCVLL